jgi:1,4-alpha-glucan branching enzyme
MGDFNEWAVENAYLMKRDETAGCWWFTLNGLDPAKEYGFQYYVGNKTGDVFRMGDAYCEKILDPDNDPSIPASTYPNLQKYPKATVGIVSVFQTVPQPYSWQVPNFRIADPDQLMIYELLFRDFTESGDIQGAMQKLSYLKELGVNAIELMPIQEFDGNDSWGYNPCFYFALDKAYGTKEMYKQFIDACHQQGLAVILDVVYNHATGSNPFAKLYWNGTANKTVANNPWFNVDAPHPYSVFHDFNHESPLVRQFVKRNLKFLLEEYKVDGFRFDLTKGFTQKSSTEGTASNYDATRIAILKDYHEAVAAANPNACMILEHFCVDQEEKELVNAGMKVWRNLNNAYCQSGMGYPENSSFTGLYTGTNGMTSGGYVGYMESHDEERVGYKQTAYSQEPLKSNLTERMKQLTTNAAFFLTVPGPKMIWQFGELGYDFSINENGRTGKKPIKWDYYTVAQRKALYTNYSKLLKLREKNEDLFGTNATFSWKVETTDWAAGRFLTVSAGGKSLVVVGNFTSNAINATATFPATGTWYNLLTNEPLTVSSINQSVTIPAHDVDIYTSFEP